MAFMHANEKASSLSDEHIIWILIRCITSVKCFSAEMNHLSLIAAMLAVDCGEAEMNTLETKRVGLMATLSGQETCATS